MLFVFICDSLYSRWVLALYLQQGKTLGTVLLLIIKWYEFHNYSTQSSWNMGLCIFSVNYVLYSKKTLAVKNFSNLANGVQFAKVFRQLFQFFFTVSDDYMRYWTNHPEPSMLSCYLPRKTVKIQHNFIISSLRWICTWAGMKL